MFSSCIIGCPTPVRVGKENAEEREPHGSHTQNSGPALQSNSPYRASELPTDTKPSLLESPHRHRSWFFIKKFKHPSVVLAADVFNIFVKTVTNKYIGIRTLWPTKRDVQWETRPPDQNPLQYNPYRNHCANQRNYNNSLTSKMKLRRRQEYQRSQGTSVPRAKVPQCPILLP